MNTDQRTSSIREVTEYHGSPIYPVLGSGTSSGEADAIKGNDCPDMNNILLLRSGDVERNPGPNDKPGNLTDLELYLLADIKDPSDYRTRLSKRSVGVGTARMFKQVFLALIGYLKWACLATQTFLIRVPVSCDIRKLDINP
eukprot:XP_011678404.1 PREDICTED: uncharacterized protein LOC105445068 [Strongylocentrotus purpuratus]